MILKKGTSPSTWTTNAIGAGAGAVICLLGSVALGEPHALPQTRQEWWPILYLVVAGNLGAYALYAWLVQVPGKGFGRALATVDERVVDGAVNGTGSEVRQASRIAPIVQSGFVRSYALAFLLGVAALLLFLGLRF